MNTGVKNLKYMLSLCLLFICFSASAQEKTVPTEASSVYSNPLFIALMSIIFILLMVIIVFADLVKAGAHLDSEKQKEKKDTSINIMKMLLIIIIGSFSNTLFAQAETAPVKEVATSYYGLDGFTFYLLISIIACESIIAWKLYVISMNLLGITEIKRREAEEEAKLAVKKPSLIEKMNDSVSIEKEADIMLDHNYDGIRELDNNLPPWWKYGFYLTIVFAVIYLIHFHVTNTGKLQIGEYEEQLSQAKFEMEEYRKKAANLVDENNATMLTDEASISSGKGIYMDNCAACHGRAAEGGVGPNLTDDYWLHNGSVKDIFKTIKYGYPEKGMKSWQQDLGAKQIHEVSSFIKSLRGSNPANPKAKQGELYKEEVVADSLQVVLKEK